MADCLIEYILLDGVPETVTPNSGLYLNRELSIPMAKFSSMVTTDQQNLAGIWDEIQIKAIRKFTIRLRLGMTELFADCSPVTDEWICRNRETLAMPFIYFLGIEFCIGVAHTNRINRYTTIDKDRAAEMRAEFEEEFKLQLKSALQVINSKATNKATENGDVFTYVEVIP